MSLLGTSAKNAAILWSESDPDEGLRMISTHFSLKKTPKKR